MNQRAFLALVLCALLAGVSGIMIKFMTSMNAGSIAFFRTGVPTLLILSWLLTNKIKIFRGNNRAMLTASAINAFRMYLYLIAYIYTSIGNAVILFYSWPIFVTFFSAIWLKEKVGRQQFGLLILAFAGLVIAYSNKTFTFEDRDFIGMIAAVISSAAYAVTVVIYKSESQNYHPYEMIFLQNMIGAIVFIPLFFGNFQDAEWGHMGMASIYGAIIGIVVFGLFFYALRTVKASLASSMMFLEVVSAILLSFVILGESLSPTMILGGSLILLSSFFLNRIGKA